MQKKIKNKPKRKKTKVKKEKIYFDSKTEKAIVSFQNELNIEKRKKIFIKKIKPCLDKLIENIIFTYKFHSLDNIDNLKNDCLSFLFENLNKFDPTRNFKAFSYFSVISKNFFIQKVKRQ